MCSRLTDEKRIKYSMLRNYKEIIFNKTMLKNHIVRKNQEKFTYCSHHKNAY
jgi:hypothetical protein